MASVAPSPEVVVEGSVVAGSVVEGGAGDVVRRKRRAAHDAREPMEHEGDARVQLLDELEAADDALRADLIGRELGRGRALDELHAAGGAELEAALAAAGAGARDGERLAAALRVGGRRIARRRRRGRWPRWAPAAAVASSSP